MPNELISNLYDLEALQAQQDQFISYLQESKAAILDLNNQRVTVKSADLSEFTAATKNLNDAINQSTTATTKATTANQQLTKAQIEARLANQQRTAAIKDEIISNNAAAGSYVQLQQQLKSLTTQYKALSQTERDSSIGKQLAVDVATANAQLKILDAGLGNYQRNVGNYNNSLGLISKGVKGIGGLGVILSKALGIDPSIAIGIEEVGRAIRDLQHARELQQTGLEAEAKLYEINSQKIDAQAAALDGETISTGGAAEAQTGLTASTETAGVAQEEMAVKTEAVAVALDAEAASADIAKVSTEALSTSLGSGLVGGAVLALAAIVAVYEAIKDSNEEIKNQEEAYKELEIIIGEISSAVKKYEDLREVTAQKELKDLAEQIELRKAAGISAIDALAQDKALASAQLKTATDQAAYYSITKGNVANAKADALASATQLKNAELEKQKLLKQSGEVEGYYNSTIVKLEVEATNKKIEEFKKQADATKSFYDFINGILQKQVEAQNKIDLVTTQADKLNADERRALILAEATAEAEIIESKNAIILSSEKSTLAQRVAALKSNQKEQLSVISATLDSTLNDPTKKNDPLLVAAAEAKANAERVKINDQAKKAIFDTNESYRQRDLKAETDYTNSVLTEDKARSQNSLTDRYTDLQNNLDAIQQFGEDQNAILFNNEQLQLQKLGLTDKEKLGIEEKYNADVLANNIDTRNKLVAAQEKAVADQVAALKYLRDQKIADANDASQINTDSRATNLINQAAIDKAGKSAEQRKKIEEKLQIDLLGIDKQGELDRLAISDQDLNDQLANAILAGNDTADIEAKITANKRKEAELRKGITDAEVKYEEEQRNKLLETVLTVENSILEITQAIGDGRFQVQKDQAQKEEDLLDSQTQKQIDAVNASIASDQDKAAQIAIINAKAQAEKEALDLRQRKADHDKAKFDKEIAILQIIAQIAIDIAELKYGAAALAGVALVKLIATPIPAYKGGRGEGKDEIAYVGDGGVSEYIHRADGTIEKTPAVETLTHLMPKDRVYKDKAAMMKELALSSFQLSDYRVNEGGNIEHAIERMSGRIEEAVSQISFHHTTVTKGGWRTHNEKLANYDRWVNKTIKN